ncbi:MAG: hypothetical protein OEO21_02175 [Candidatus Krumholzibacteria bacterium]|nr:hypothetical protein [Candidatus Krumholzibacteria bacterium]
MEHEFKINARGLSGPGARMMVDTALAQQHPTLLRVVVSAADAADAVASHLGELGATVKVDQVGEEYHVLAALADES